MIKQTLRSTFFVLAIACACGALAQFSQNNGDTHTEMRDKSNVRIDGTNWGITLQTSASAAPLFINSMSITPGAGYDNNIGMQTQVGGFNFNGSSNGFYTFGDAITGDNFWNFSGAFHNGAIDSSVSDGVYDFSLGIFGGANNTTTDLLASYALHVDVIQKIDITTTFTANPNTILEGGTGTELSMTVTNNMTGKNFISSTWYVSGFGDGQGNYLPFDNFTGNWFNQVITPGNSHTDTHSTWHAALNTPIGLYTGDNGVVGGPHNGDFYFMNTDQNAEVTVLVPEPASFAVLGVGVLALIRRRRK